MQRVLVHTCFQHKPGLEIDSPLSPVKCRCRRRISAEQAAKKVDQGLAQYVVVAEKQIEIEEICGICFNDDKYKKRCKTCDGIGLIRAKRTIKIHGRDIIETVSPDGRRKTATVKVKKSPTIERAHIERAFVEQKDSAKFRIEEYERLINEALLEFIKGPEPEDDPKKGTGRKYDWGRPVY